MKSLYVMAACVLQASGNVTAADAATSNAWQTLGFDTGFNRWRKPVGAWFITEAPALDPSRARFLQDIKGTGACAVNGADGKEPYLVSKEDYGDCEIHVEFMVAKNSNSGVYVMGSYEVQIFDSHAVVKDKYPGIECGGVYPQWIAGTNQNGHTPSVNVSKPYGEWQSFDIVFRAPRFNTTGVKTANATFVKVIHNGTTIHENVEVLGPTHGGFSPEKAVGPLRLQGDHGPVAYRNVRIRPLVTSGHPIKGTLP